MRFRRRAAANTLPTATAIRSTRQRSGTYGLGFQTRAQYAIAGNVHFAPTPKDDLSAVFLTGAAAYQQYDSPYQGPAVVDVQQPHRFGFPASRPIRISRSTRLRSREVPTASKNCSGSTIGSTRSAGFSSSNRRSVPSQTAPSGTTSLSPTASSRSIPRNPSARTASATTSRIKPTTRTDFRAGAQYDVNTSSIYQIVPTVPQIVTAAPRLNQYLVYGSDTWSVTPSLSAMGSLRYVGQHAQTSDNPPVIYGDGAIDPHLALAYTFAGQNGLRATFDHNSVIRCRSKFSARAFRRAPAATTPAATPTERSRASRWRPRPRTITHSPTNTAAERRSVSPTSLSWSRTSSTCYRQTTVLRSMPVKTPMRSAFPRTPESYVRTGSSAGSETADSRSTPITITRSRRASISSPSTISTPRRFSPGTSSRPTTFRTSPRRLPTSSISCAGAYASRRCSRTRVAILMATARWSGKSSTASPSKSPTTTTSIPGTIIYFLKNPSLPYNAATNPYIANLGTNEGADPNTLRTTPQTLVSLHVEGDISPRVTAILDVVNLFGTATPTQLQGNPYLIGPPGYTGGNPLLRARVRLAILQEVPLHTRQRHTYQ